MIRFVAVLLLILSVPGAFWVLERRLDRSDRMSESWLAKRWREAGR